MKHANRPHRRRRPFPAFVFPMLALALGCGSSGGGGPVITVTSPMGGETWYHGGPDQEITWTSAGLASNVDIAYTLDGTIATPVWVDLATDVADTGSFTWTIPDTPSTSCLVRVMQTGGGTTGKSSTFFAISLPVLEVTSPNGGETWGAGSTREITWTGGGMTDVKIELSRDENWDDGDGSDVEVLSAATDVTLGSFTWTVAAPADVGCLVRVSDAADGTPWDVSDDTFDISRLVLDSPLGGESWELGSAQSVEWTAENISDVRIELSRDGNWVNGDGSDVERLTDGTPAGAGFPWTTSGPVSDQCLVRISDAANSGAIDMSTAAFTIAGLTLVSPNGGERLATSTNYEITWASAGTSGTVDVEYTTDSTAGTVVWTPVPNGTGIADSGSLLWAVPAVASSNCRVRVTEVGGAARQVESASDFTISTVWYVRSAASPGGDGRSWAAAFQDPQDAVDAATAPDVVWVAEGVYGVISPNTTVLTLKAGVAVYGGFIGTETNKEQRDVDANVTEIDVTGAFHGLKGADDAIIDGFTISGGVANGGSGDSDGAGMYNANVQGVIIANCTFEDNTAASEGGAVHNRNNTSAHFIDCVFEDNIANWGGAVYNTVSPVQFTRCEFTLNSVVGDRDGGAIYSIDCAPQLTSCAFEANDALLGGAVRGANADYSFDRCMFAGNNARRGGAVYCTGSDISVVNCVFSCNRAVRRGGGLWYRNGIGTVTNCTFASNTAGIYGGGIYVEGSPIVTVTNCILWQNTGGMEGDVHVQLGGTPVVTVTYSCISQAGYAGTGQNIDSDPAFQDEAGADYVPGTLDDDVSLQHGSPCIDKGTSAGAPDEDIDGQPRPARSGYDMGAYERQ